MILHPHTRSDYPQPTSPRIPCPARCITPTAISPAIERRIRTILTWEAGGCGLISDQAIEIIGTYYLDNLITLPGIRRLAKPLIYAVILGWIADERERRAAARRPQRSLGAARS
jgi:hypothetical protein